MRSTAAAAGAKAAHSATASSAPGTSPDGDETPTSASSSRSAWPAISAAAVSTQGSTGRDAIGLGLQAARVASDEAAHAPRLETPARAAPAPAARVEPQAGDVGERVTAVGIDSDPAALAAQAEAAGERARDERRVQQAARVEDVGDGARAVVAAGIPLGVAAAPDVGLALDPVARGDRTAHGARRAGGSV